MVHQAGLLFLVIMESYKDLQIVFLQYNRKTGTNVCLIMQGLTGKWEMAVLHKPGAGTISTQLLP